MDIKNSNTTTGDKSICQIIKDFLFHCQFEKRLSPKTLKAYEIDLKQFEYFLNKNGANAIIENVSKEQLKDYLQSISHFKTKTIKRKVASLKAMLNYIEYEDDNYINPFSENQNSY